MESTNLPSAVFFCIAAHYVFNLAYHKKTTDFWQFIEEWMVENQHIGEIQDTNQATRITRMFKQIYSAQPN